MENGVIRTVANLGAGAGLIDPDGSGAQVLFTPHSFHGPWEGAIPDRRVRFERYAKHRSEAKDVWPLD